MMPTHLPTHIHIQLVTAAKVDFVVGLARDALAQGHCPVIGLQVRAG